MEVFSEVNPIVISGTYSQENMDRLKPDKLTAHQSSPRSIWMGFRLRLFNRLGGWKETLNQCDQTFLLINNQGDFSKSNV